MKFVVRLCDEIRTRSRFMFDLILIKGHLGKDFKNNEYFIGTLRTCRLGLINSIDLKKVKIASKNENSKYLT